MTRKVHLRPSTAISIGHTRTYCGRVIHYVHPDTVLSSAVVDFDGFDATVHGTLVTCERCERGTYHTAIADRSPKGRDKGTLGSVHESGGAGTAIAHNLIGTP